MPDKTFDIVIIGAGPGGSAAAYYLARRGLAVLLLDKADFPRDKTCGDGLTPRAVSVLKDMGLLDQLLQVGHRTPRLEIVAPLGHSVGSAIPQVGDWPAFTLVVPRLILDDLLLQKAVAAGAVFRGGTRVSRVETSSDGVTVYGARKDGTVEVRARAAIVATGASPTLLMEMGILKKTPAMMIASRAYFEDMQALKDEVYLTFEGVPLPGYGWVFPVSETSANIGAGLVRRSWTSRWRKETSAQAFQKFIATPTLKAMLDGARQVGPVKGYPLRMDFAQSPTYGERTLLVGEAAGLVNPLTGEGIDYALESGRIAAEHLAGLFEAGDFSQARFAEYDAILRQRFQRLFVFCDRVRATCLNPLLLNPLVAIANYRTDLKLRLIYAVLGLRGAPLEATGQPGVDTSDRLRRPL
ncbi:MAG: geranylgeranyl reductase family protein [Anaerolineae bacterium]